MFFLGGGGRGYWCWFYFFLKNSKQIGLALHRGKICLHEIPLLPFKENILKGSWRQRMELVYRYVQLRARVELLTLCFDHPDRNLYVVDWLYRPNKMYWTVIDPRNICFDRLEQKNEFDFARTKWDLFRPKLSMFRLSINMKHPNG